MLQKNRNVMLKIIIIIALFEAVFGDTSYCTTPDKKQGKCVPFRECKNLYQQLQAARDNSTIKNFIRSSYCKFEGNTYYVCCADSQKCGAIIGNRIINGNEPYLGELPWFALLIYSKPFYKTGYHCGGTLISMQHVITAAHCVSKKVIPVTWDVERIRFGEHNISSAIDCMPTDQGTDRCSSAVIDANISKIIIHEKYNPVGGGSPNDIALIKLVEELPYTEFIRPICLPSPDEIVFGFGTVAGFGKTEEETKSKVLLKTEVDIQDHTECSNKYRVTGKILQNTQFCAVRGVSDACNGDSGGGLFQERDGAWKMYGIVSFGPRVCGSGPPGVYTSVPHFIGWINDKLAQ